MTTLAQMQIMASLKAKMAAAKAAQQSSPQALALEAAKQAEAEVQAKLAQQADEARKAAEALAKAAAQQQVNKLGVTIDMLNEKQRAALNMEAQGVSFCVTGAAGTGKTTIQRMVVRQALDSGRVGKITCNQADDIAHKYLRNGGPSVLIVSYTNVATNNIKATLPEELAAHCMTIHKALQYTPQDVTVEEVDELGEDAGERTTMRFIPTYGQEPTSYGGSGLGLGNYLPHFDLVIVEEAGTVPVYLYKALRSALPDPDKTRWIFLGDIEQLDPAFGDGILGYMMLALPYVRLSEVYRNVGLVTKFAHRILAGRAISDTEILNYNKEDDSGKLEFRQFKRKATSMEQATTIIGDFFRKMALEGRFNPDNTMVLLPFNVKLGTQAIGRYIAEGFQKQDWKTVYEVRAGRQIYHLCKGDRVFLNKSYYEITDIQPNKFYMADRPRPPSRLMDRWGRLIADAPDWVVALEQDWLASHGAGEDVGEDDTLDILNMEVEDLKEAKGAASHVLTLQQVNTLNNVDGVRPTISVKSGTDLADMQFSYALTTHKAQGSEWENVYVVMHVEHSVMLCREWFYTACTRARRNLTVLFDGEASAGASRSTLRGAVIKQSIPGATLEQKLQHFRNKLAKLYASTPVEEALKRLNDAA